MARKFDDELIHCPVCGEDYSSTYRRCPFCGERVKPKPVEKDPDDDFEDDYVFDGQHLFDDPDADPVAPGRGGKRLVSGGSHGRYDPPGPVNWMRVITFALSLVIIVVALIIIFTVIYPKLHDPDPTPSDTSSQVTDTDAVDSPGASDTDSDPVDSVVTDNPLNSLTFANPNDYDFTLLPGQSHTPTPVLDPVDWDGTLTWTSSDESLATVDENGTVTNVNQLTALRRVIITVTGGGQTVEITVYCRGVDAGEDTPPVTTPNPDPDPSDSSSTSDTLPAGSTATITGASGGLRVRSGPGTSYKVQATLTNGAEVTIVEYASDGWYKISYYGSNGPTTGYVLGDYLKAK